MRPLLPQIAPKLEGMVRAVVVFTFVTLTDCSFRNKMLCPCINTLRNGVPLFSTSTFGRSKHPVIVELKLQVVNFLVVIIHIFRDLLIETPNICFLHPIYTFITLSFYTSRSYPLQVLLGSLTVFSIDNVTQVFLKWCSNTPDCPV